MDTRKELVKESQTETCAFCSQIISNITTTYEGKIFCSAKCMIKQKEKDDGTSSSNEPENEGNSNTTPSDNNGKTDQLTQTKSKAVDEIITALYAHEPRIDNNELDLDYQN